MIEFELTGGGTDRDGAWKTVTFSSNSKELYSMAYEMLSIIADAMAWRNRVQQVTVKEFPHE